MSYRAPLFRWLRHWHARIGLVAALFFLLLIVSGIALNHTDALKLDQRHLGASWLTRWYGLRTDVPTQGFALGTQYLTWDAQRWVLGTHVVAANQGIPVGAVRLNDVYYIAAREALYLYSPVGQLIDKLGGDALPARPLLRLSSSADRVTIETPAGSFSSGDAVTWSPVAAVADWSTPVTLPDSVQAALRPIYAPTINSERLLLDLHSGRFFGRFGPIVVDAAAIALLLLAVSGVWMYMRAARLQKHREKR